MDDTVIVGRVLTPAEVQSLYDAMVAKPVTKPTAGN